MQSDTPFSVDFIHRLRFTNGTFDPANPCLVDVLRTDPGDRARAAVFVDAGVAAAWPDLETRIARYWEANLGMPELVSPPRTVVGGEPVKNESGHVEQILRDINDDGLCRHSYVIVIGGGAVLDAVGYAAAIAHRGVRLVRLPTTTLGQCDSGVGVKNGVNAFGKKNYLGVFTAPWAVVNGSEFLGTLSERDWRAGFSEAVKVGLVKDRDLFDRVDADADAIRCRDAGAAGPVLEASARLHLRHITESGDPFEMTVARPLDFGHWSAHKLEQMTSFRIRHGEAVALGIAIDVAYSMLSGWLSRDHAERVASCLRRLGFQLWDEALEETAVLLAGLEEFREHLGGRTAIAMLNGLGSSFDVHEMDVDRVAEAIRWVGGVAQNPSAHRAG